MKTALAAIVALLTVCDAVRAQPAGTAQKPTGVIRGHVALPNGRPARRALVRMIGPNGGFPRTATTDNEGRFEITEVAAGEYLVSAGKPGYLALQYGQRRAFERGSVITVRAGQKIEGIDITLQASSVISGRVFDENGEAVEGVHIRLMELMTVGGRRQMLAVAGVSARMVTDDHGRYRLYGISPGRYTVSAFGDAGTSSPIVLPSDYGTTYFPGRARPSEAQFVNVGLSQELDGVDIMLARGTGATIRGTVVDSQGKPVDPLILVVTSQRSGGVGAEPAAVRSPGDGRFETSRLPPGEYVLQALAGSADVNAGREREFASRFVTVADADVSDVNLRTSAGSRLEGRITFEGGGSTDYEGVTLNTMPSDFDRAPLTGPSGRATGRADGTFVLEGLNGPRRLRLMRAPAGWSLKTIRVNGRDITDEPQSFGTSDESLTDVEVMLTNRAASISGRVSDAQGHPVDDYTAIVFATSSDRWYQGTRFLNFTRP
ncbi:MAG TPA: carboxypeptidase-like regulatory domain-containing protein, partial [Vicinamibacterales bacterium]|nr:carboxypeptidase-like regulatory domain-containing protein [Vicinamibacterales bacterium]